MLKKTLLAVAGTAAALGFSSAALADPPRWAPAYGWREHQRYEHREHEHYRPYYYAPRAVYVEPAPRVVYAPAPVVVYPAPVYHRSAPAYVEPSFSIRFDFPL